MIEGERYVYTAQERLPWPWKKAANVTVNGPVKYAIDKGRFFLLDDDGKEHELEITRKELLAPGAPPR